MVLSFTWVAVGSEEGARLLEQLFPRGVLLGRAARDAGTQLPLCGPTHCRRCCPLVGGERGDGTARDAVPLRRGHVGGRRRRRWRRLLGKQVLRQRRAIAAASRKSGRVLGIGVAWNFLRFLLTMILGIYAAGGAQSFLLFAPRAWRQRGRHASGLPLVLRALQRRALWGPVPPWPLAKRQPALLAALGGLRLPLSFGSLPWVS